MEFDEVREYQPGDDVRTIDWNVTARTGTPFIKRFCEERELTILFAVDASASGAFGSGQRSKLEMVVEVAAVMMFSALKNNDKVGLVTFCDTVLGYYPPRKGKSNVLHLIRELISIEPVARPTSLAAALEFLSRVQNRRAVVFLLSDFQAPETRQALALCNSRHDLIAVTRGRSPRAGPARRGLHLAGGCRDGPGRGTRHAASQGRGAVCRPHGAAGREAFDRIAQGGRR